MAILTHLIMDEPLALARARDRSAGARRRDALVLGNGRIRRAYGCNSTMIELQPYRKYNKCREKTAASLFDVALTATVRWRRDRRVRRGRAVFTKHCLIAHAPWFRDGMSEQTGDYNGNES